MTLSFQTKIDGQPTHFMEKIIRGYFWTRPVSKEVAAAFHHVEFKSSVLSNCKSKLHTIREDKKNRWRVGMDIHFVIHNRTKKRFQFAPVLKVKCIQSVEIRYNIKRNITIANVRLDGLSLGHAAWQNCKLVFSSSALEDLAKNDGFDSVNAFFEWFKEDFTGKIIHWTDLKY